jgi:primosomal replication protein N
MFLYRVLRKEGKVMENNQNLATLVGKLTNVRKVWSSAEHVTYEGILEVIRESGVVDHIPVLIKDTYVEDKTDGLVEVIGQFRSRDIDNNGKLKVELYVYAQTITSIESSCKNSIQVTGYVCKKPSLRTTPSGKQISDLLIACNYNKDKTAYIPVVTWGKYARYSGKYQVGALVSINGRIQSRTYTKEINNSIETRIAHELSATSIELVN